MTRTHPFKVLIADDNPDNITLLQRRLRHKNYTFYTAFDGQETLDVVKETPPDLILLDVSMPKLNGFEVCRRLRADEATRSIPIIIITAAKTSVDDQVKGLGLGADDYIIKPFKAMELVARVDRKLEVKALEDELRRQKEELSAILVSTSDPILRIGTDGLLKFFNQAAAQIFALDLLNTDSSKNAIGLHYKEVLAISPNFVIAFDKITEAQIDKPANFEVTLPDDMVLFVNIAPISSPGQPFDGWVLVLHDISHLKKLSRLKSSAIANAAHDLRNPLSSAILYTQMLIESIPEESDPQYVLATRALASIEYIQHLTVHLLDLEKLETGEILEIIPCNVNKVIQDVIYQMEPLAHKRDIELIIDLSQNPITINADSIYLSRAIANLINNALKFTPPGGSVSVSLKTEAKNLIIAVHDTGPGISPEHQTQIFNRFYRIRKNVETPGSGLGLSIVKSIVKQHNGLVWLESELGKGSTFYISLPC